MMHVSGYQSMSPICDHLIVSGNDTKGWRVRGENRYRQVLVTDTGKPVGSAEEALAAFLKLRPAWAQAPAYRIETAPSMLVPRDGIGFDQ